MYYNNTAYQQAINAPSRRIIGNVTIKNRVISDDISSIDYVSSISGNTLTIGSTNASTVEIKFKKLIEGLQEREMIKVSFSVKTPNGFVDRQVGEFYLTEIKLDRNNKTTSLKAIDKMGFLNDEYKTNLGYPTLGKNIVQEIANKCDLKVNNNINITNLPSFSKKLEKVTYREVLGYIAQTVGAFVTFNNNGELEFRKLTRTDKRIAKSSYMLKGLEVDEVEYRINGISVDLKNQEKTILAVGSPLGTQVKLSNPIMTQSWLNNVFSEYGKLRFNPFKLNWRGDPFVEVGDWVSIEIANGSYRAFPILELKLSYNGGLKSTIGANVKGTATSSTEYKGTVERQIEFINARLGATGNLVYADTVEPKNPKEGDTWFKPNGAFTELYIYEGDKWVLKTSTGDVDGLVTKITDSSVTTKNLAAAIGKIIELDANRITTGALSFDRLSSDTVKQIRNGLMTETKFNSYVNDENGIRQQMGTEIERVIKSKASELKGRDGIDGRTSYFHTAYANSQDGRQGFSTTDGFNKIYVGTYSDFTEADSTDPTKYTWTKIKGDDGRNGRDGKGIGVNLVPETGTPKSKESSAWQGDWYARTHKFYFNNGKNIMTLANDTTKENYIISPRFKLERNTDYALSFKGFASNNVQNMDVFILGRRTGEEASYTIIPNNTPLVRGKVLDSTKVEDVKNVTFNSGEMDEAFLRFDNNGSKDGNTSVLFIAEVKLEKGKESTDWTPAPEDLQGHSLTASLRFEGTYINNVTNNVKVFVDVFYDGQKITSGFELKWRYNGGNRTTWSNFGGVTPVNNDGYIPAINWGNGTQNGTPLECIVSVSYKGLNALASGRMENMPDIVEIKETIKKYKTFDSTLEQFTSVIGEVDTKVLTKAYARNNLNAEDVEKTGNDVYYNVKGKLEAGKTYTIFANLDNVPDNQEVKIYRTSGDMNKRIVSNGLNYWVATYGNDETRVNFYPLGKDTKISNVKIFEGDLRSEGLGENLYDINKPIGYTHYKPENYGIITIPLKEAIVAGDSYEINFDVEEPKGTWDVNFRQGWTPEMLENIFLKNISEIEKNITLKMKSKGNHIVFRAGGYMPNVNMMFGIFYVSDTPINKITNIRVYKKPNYALGYAESSEIYNINSKISQTKYELNLSVEENIKKFTDVINANNLYKSTSFVSNNTSVISVMFNTKIQLERNTDYTVYFKLTGALKEDIGKKMKVSNGSTKTTELDIRNDGYSFVVSFPSDLYFIKLDNLPRKYTFADIRIYKGNTLGYGNIVPLEYLKSEIDILKNKILISVDDGGKAKSEIELLKDRIKQSVTVGEFGTQLLQNQYSLRVAWNNISNYLQFENGGLTIYNGVKSENQKRSRFDENGSWYYRDGYTVGKIGTNFIKNNSAMKGLEFDLEAEAAYMTWSALPYKGADAFEMKWTYANKSFGGFVADRLYAGCDVDLYNYTLRNARIDVNTFYTGGVTASVNIVHTLQGRSDGGVSWTYGTMVFKNGILIRSTV